tara:strand:+ start:288 stop:479 length:192 start_codon:yes stop_codon:yes gene_type:complete
VRRKYSNKRISFGELIMGMTEAVETKNENVETDVPVAPPVEVVAVVEVVETTTVTETPQGAGV